MMKTGFSFIQVRLLLLGISISLLIFSPVAAQLQVPPMFSDHAVLQRNKPVAIWGMAAANSKVTVTLAGKSLTFKADKKGVWNVSFPAMPAGGPFTLTVASGKQQVSFADIWLGEVWLCSGQSNMEWKLSQAQNYAEEKPKSNLPMVRQFYVDHEVTLQPKQNLEKGDWKVCTPETSGGFTAVGYFFAKEIQKELNVAVGLIHSSWGGYRTKN